MKFQINVDISDIEIQKQAASTLLSIEDAGTLIGLAMKIDIQQELIALRMPTESFMVSGGKDLTKA